MRKATRERKKNDEPLRGGTNQAPTLHQWTEEARKLAESQAADTKPADMKGTPTHKANGQYVGDINVDKPIPFAPTRAGEAIDKVVNRVNELNGHVNDGDWRAERKADLKDIAERRNQKVGEKTKLKAQYAAATKEVEALDAELLAAVRDIDKPYPPKPAKLYPDPPKPATSKKSAPPTDDDTWRRVPLASLNLAKGILEKLAKPVHKHRGAVPPIKTLGDLTEFLEPKDGWEPRLTDIKGLGKTAIDKITAATDQFWAERGKAADTKPKADAETTKT